MSIRDLARDNLRTDNPFIVRSVEINGELLELFAENVPDQSGDAGLPPSYQNWVLRVVTLDRGAGVVAVQREPLGPRGADRWWLRVWRWDGQALGCSPYVDREGICRAGPNSRRRWKP